MDLSVCDHDPEKDRRMGPMSRQSSKKRWYFTLAVALLLLAGFVADRMDAPTWVDLVLIAITLILLPFAIRTALRELRSGDRD